MRVWFIKRNDLGKNYGYIIELMSCGIIHYAGEKCYAYPFKKKENAEKLKKEIKKIYKDVPIKIEKCWISKNNYLNRMITILNWRH